MAARRAGPGGGRSPSYSFAELARLLGVSERRARAAARRLVASGLLEWSASAITFPGPSGEGEPSLADSIGRGRGSLAVPRRMLRFLARGAPASLIATALGFLARCLSRRRAGWDGRGRVKSSWVADAFGVDLRSVKRARARLVALGWLAPAPSVRRAENSWGWAFRVALAWAPPAPPGGEGRAGAGRRSPPPPPPGVRAIATPSVDQEPLTGAGKDQEPRRPRAGGGWGSARGGAGDGGGPPSPPAARPAPTAPPGPARDATRGPGPALAPAPALGRAAGGPA